MSTHSKKQSGEGPGDGLSDVEAHKDKSNRSGAGGKIAQVLQQGIIRAVMTVVQENSQLLQHHPSCSTSCRCCLLHRVYADY